MKFHAWIVIFLIPLAFSCTDDDFPVTLQSAQAQRLLTNDSSKVWVPVIGQSFQDCAIDDQYKFTRSRIKDQLGEYWVHPGTILCDGDGEIKGTWEIIEENGKNQLSIHTSTTDVYQIDLITASQLRLLDNNQEIRTFIARP